MTKKTLGKHSWLGCENEIRLVAHIRVHKATKQKELFASTSKIVADDSNGESASKILCEIAP